VIKTRLRIGAAAEEDSTQSERFSNMSAISSMNQDGVIKNGFLYKIGDSFLGAKGWKKRRFEVEQGVLRYYDGKTLKGEISLTSATLPNHEETHKEVNKTKSPPQGWSYRFVVVSGTRHWMFAANSSVEREAWYFSILNCCGEKRTNNNERSSTTMSVNAFGDKYLIPPTLSEQLQLQGGMNSIKKLITAVNMALVETSSTSILEEDDDNDDKDDKDDKDDNDDKDDKDDKDDTDDNHNNDKDKTNLLRVFETCDAEIVLSMLDTSTRGGGMFVEEKETAKRMVTQYAKANDQFMAAWSVYLRTAQDRFDFEIKHMANTFESARRDRGKDAEQNLKKEKKNMQVRNFPSESTDSIPEKVSLVEKTVKTVAKTEKKEIIETTIASVIDATAVTTAVGTSKPRGTPAIRGRGGARAPARGRGGARAPARGRGGARTPARAGGRGGRGGKMTAPPLPRGASIRGKGNRGRGGTRGGRGGRGGRGKQII